VYFNNKCSNVSTSVLWWWKEMCIERKRLLLIIQRVQMKESLELLLYCSLKRLCRSTCFLTSKGPYGIIFSRMRPTDSMRLPSWHYFKFLRKDKHFLIRIVGGGVQTESTNWPIVPAPADGEDGEFGGMNIGRGNRSTRRKPAPASLCPPQIALNQTRARNRAAAVGNQRLTA
jgi:hypothetical protein